jgi:hypothetical protein
VFAAAIIIAGFVSKLKIPAFKMPPSSMSMPAVEKIESRLRSKSPTKKTRFAAVLEEVEPEEEERVSRGGARRRSQRRKD